MGATKWLCEEVVRAMATRYPDTTYRGAVRQVLDSRGSVNASLSPAAPGWRASHRDPSRRDP